MGVRPAVLAVPAYPFSPIQVPIKLDQNENPYDFPAELKARAAERMLAQPWNRYPDLHADTLAAKIAEYEGWDARGVVVTPGSNVLIKLLTELAGIEQTVLTVDPTFSVYTLEAKMLGARLVGAAEPRLFPAGGPPESRAPAPAPRRAVHHPAARADRACGRHGPRARADGRRRGVGGGAG